MLFVYKLLHHDIQSNKPDKDFKEFSNFVSEFATTHKQLFIPVNGLF